jgi:asparagine synthase (glutamine-hydrolysing)
MCGIAGIVNLDGRPVDPRAVKRMTDVMAHRGPDDAGYVFFRPAGSRSREGDYWCEFVDPVFAHINENLPPYGGRFFRDEFSRNDFAVGMGHRRLAVIDLTHYGHQPMPSSDRRYWITYNGEIYNFPELREDLEARGHIFRTRSDTEVILHLWEEYGTDCLPMLDGMFAFALYDREENLITIVRDRFGVKPLYYAFVGDGFLFGSEIKAIVAAKAFTPEIDPDALAEYFTFQNLYGARTLFKEIKLLAPGGYMTVGPSYSTDPSPKEYHAPFPVVDHSLLDRADLADTVADSFAAAVRRQLISDVEVGAYLSGGMDSGSIVAVAGNRLNRLTTFTAGFDLTNVDGIEQGFDERIPAEQLSYLLQTEHYAVVLHAGDMPAAMEKITWHMDDPRVGMCHQNWYAAKLAGRFVKVCLAGAGGDELFGGYPWRYRHCVGANDFEEFDGACFRQWHRLLPPEELPRLFSPDLRAGLASAWESYVRTMEGAPPFSKDMKVVDNMIQRALYFEFKTFMQGFLITEDRMSMAHGLETRVPFLDNGLAELAWSIPPSLKVDTAVLNANSHRPHMESAEGKLILRRAMEAFLPAEYTSRKKQGFSPPDENWYRGPSMDYIKEILLDERTRTRPWFDHDFVGAKLEEHFQGLRNHRLLIWSLLSVEWLQRHFIDKKVGQC